MICGSGKVWRHILQRSSDGSSGNSVKVSKEDILIVGTPARKMKES